MVLHIRPLSPDDEAELRLACSLMEPSDFEFAFDFHEDTDFIDYLHRLDLARIGHDLGEGRVPSTYLIGEVDGRIVGRVSIRHELNEHLMRNGGHIGYGVLPRERGRGYAQEMLRRALEEAQRLGIDRVLLTCDAANQPSIRVIERCGGHYEPTNADREAGIRRYWIDTK